MSGWLSSARVWPAQVILRRASLNVPTVRTAWLRARVRAESREQASFLLLAISSLGIAGIPLLAGIGIPLLVGCHAALAAGLALYRRPSRLKIAAVIFAMIWWPITVLLIVGALLPVVCWTAAWAWRRRMSPAHENRSWPALPAEAGTQAALICSSLVLAAVAGRIAWGWIS